MTDLKPAYSWQFDPPNLRRVAGLPSPITPEWAWGGSQGDNVKVAIVDSGIEQGHAAVGGVAGAIALEYDSDRDEVVVTTGPHDDLFGHGTACAGIIRRLAPRAELYSVRVLGRDLKGKGFVFIEGLRWAIANGMRVVNLSLSTSNRDYFSAFHELADEAYFHNVMLVGAVNNVPSPSYPSDYASVFSVAATGATDPMEFSYNPVPPVEFGAPGIDIEVAWLEGSSIQATGNSFAAPHIAGVIARILGKHPDLTPFQVKTILHALSANATVPEDAR